jgi:hypothetical protein
MQGVELSPQENIRAPKLITINFVQPPKRDDHYSGPKGLSLIVPLKQSGPCRHGLCRHVTVRLLTGLPETLASPMVGMIVHREEYREIVRNEHGH